jgi:hypothetical protein
MGTVTENLLEDYQELKDKHRSMRLDISNKLEDLKAISIIVDNLVNVKDYTDTDAVHRAFGLVAENINRTVISIDDLLH